MVQVFLQSQNDVSWTSSVSPSFLSGFTGISHHLTLDLSFVTFFLSQVFSVIVGVGEILAPKSLLILPTVVLILVQTVGTVP